MYCAMAKICPLYTLANGVSKDKEKIGERKKQERSPRSSASSNETKIGRARRGWKRNSAETVGGGVRTHTIIV